jgi:cell division GTPase FtsZ
MNIKDNVLFVGLGNCGCKQAKTLHELGYKTLFANGSEQDIKILGDVPNIYKLRHFDGFGGHRERGLDCLAENVEFVEEIQNIKEEIIFVLYSAGGSTGSGLAPIVMELLLDGSDGKEQSDKIVCPIVTLPSSNEAIAKKKNAYQSMLDLQNIDGLGASFFINNNAISGDYERINMTFARMLDAFLDNNTYGELNNFDESERMEMLQQSGSMILGMFGKEHDKAFMIEKLTKNVIFVPIENDKVCGNIAVVHAGQNNTDIDVNAIVSEVGKPYNYFEGYNGGSTMIAVSGLSYPVSHIRQLGELAVRAVEERKRSRQTVGRLTELNFGDDETIIKPKTNQTQRKIDILKRRQAEIAKR